MRECLTRVPLPPALHAGGVHGFSALHKALSVISCLTPRALL